MEHKWKMISPSGKETNANILDGMRAMSREVTRLRQRHTFIVSVQQRDDLEPVSSEQAMMLLAQLITEGSFINLESIHDVTNHPSVAKKTKP
jgi:hypothetical protein